MLSLIALFTHVFVCKSQPRDSDDASRDVKPDYPNYYLHTKPSKHKDAETYCQDYCQSHLASIHVKVQYEIVKSQINDSISDNVWIGFRYMQSTKRYEWADGTTGAGYYESNNSNSSSWPIGSNQCIAISVQNNYKWVNQPCTVEQQFLCNSCTEYEEESDITEWVIYVVIFGVCFVYCCGICFVYCYMKRKIKKLKNEIKKPNGEIPGLTKDTRLAKIATTSENDLQPGLEGNVDDVMEGAQPEGHTKITKIESAVHLEVNPSDGKSEEQKENKVLDSMLTDVMKMKSLDPNQIAVVDEKKQNDSDSDDTDDMYQEEDNDEKRMLNEKNQHKEQVQNSGGDVGSIGNNKENENGNNDKSNKVLDGMLSDVMKMGSIDPNEMEQVFDDMFSDDNQQENESADT